MRIATLYLLVLLSTGCGEDESALQGLYAVTAFTTNPDACDAEGPADPDQADQTHLFVRHDEFLGVRYITSVLCTDLASCQAKAAQTDTIFLDGFLFDEGDDDAGWAGRTGLIGGDTCDGTVASYLLTGEAEVSVTIRRESRTVMDVARDGEGDCDLDAAFAQAEGQPCERLSIIRAGFVEPL